MGEQVTFEKDVANALLDAGVTVLDRETYHYSTWGLRGDYAPYHLLDGTTLTSEQVWAAVGANPGKLAAQWERGAFPYAWLDNKWRHWDGAKYVRSGMSPSDCPKRKWRLVYRPDVDLAPEEPPRPAQGTTLRAIMEWCARNGKCVTCERSVFDHAVSVDGEGDLETSFWLSVEDIYESSDWRASTDDGKTWFVPGRANPSEDMAAPDPDPDEGFQGHVGLPEESGPKETVNLDFMHDRSLPRTTHVLSEAVLHAEAGGVTECEWRLFRVRNGMWEIRAANSLDTWDADDGKWPLTTGVEYTLHPGDYLDDAPKVEPREGPELWAWMGRTGRVGRHSVGNARWVIDGAGCVFIAPNGERSVCFLPKVPCVPADGRGWGEES